MQKFYKNGWPDRRKTVSFSIEILVNVRNLEHVVLTRSAAVSQTTVTMLDSRKQLALS